jgi:hypothetical protein
MYTWMRSVSAGFAVATLLGAPVFMVYAQNTVWIDTVVSNASTLISGYLVPALMSLALVVFLWGIVVFIGNSGDETKREEGKKHMLWGVIGLFVMVVVWGIVALLTVIFGVTPMETIPPPGFTLG